jgi:hypothetical protein
VNSDARQFAPATARNREPILEVLRRVLPADGLVLEISSGTGEHATFFAPNLPGLTWQPSDPDPAARASIAAWTAMTAASNVLAPLDIDARAPVWPVAKADAIVCINMIHIAPWPATLGLFAGARRILATGGLVYLYGPFKRDGRHTAPSNAAFDESLRGRNSEWGVRDLGDVSAIAAQAGLGLAEVVAMPANNLSALFKVT